MASSLRLRVAMVAVAVLVCGGLVVRDAGRAGDTPSTIGDAAEVHNIAFSLAHGRGYGFDWDDAGWRRLYAGRNVGGRYDGLLARRGAHPTMFRPPLQPLLVAGLIRLAPDRSFLAWRLTDAVLFAVAAGLLADVGWVQGGPLGGAIMLAVLVADPLRRQFVPGWWTEGLAFDLMAAVVWLMVNGRRLSPAVYAVAGGAVVGLACLDRASFLLAVPGLCLALAVVRRGGWAWRDGWLPQAVAIGAVALAVQAPWWARNVSVAGRAVPLGSQGGFNLPDEYGPAAVRTGGVWDGSGIRDAWTAQYALAADIPLPPGHTEQSFAALWADDRRWQETADAAVCRSLASELAVSDCGRRAAVAWVRANPGQVPRLAVRKVAALTRYWRGPLAAVAVLLGLGLATSSADRQLLLGGLVLAVAGYVAAVAVTHVVYARFLVPMLPAAYAVAVLGLTGTWNRGASVKA